MELHQKDRSRTSAEATLPPGPRLPPVVQTLLMARRSAEFLTHCQRRYGDCFTLRAVRGEVLVLLAHPRLIRQVFTGDPDTYHGGEHNAALGIGAVTGSESILLLDGEAHRRQRRLVAPHFMSRSVRRYGEAITKIAERELASWPVGRPFPLHPRMQAIALEVILHAVAGIGVYDRSARQDQPDRLAELRRLLPAVADFDLLPLQVPALYRVWPWRRYRRLQERADKLLYELIAERRADPSVRERTDVLSMLVSAEDDDRLSDEELRNLLVTFLVGGHETTTTALSWTFERLMRHPAVMERLARAVREDDEEYVDAVVRETLRVRPVITLAGRRLTRPVEIAGYRLPAGVNVLPAFGLVHRSEQWFGDAEQYRPERFLESNPEPYTWAPFGGGHRRCPGAAFSTFEVKTVLRAVMSHLELAAPDPAPERPRVRHVTLVPHKGAQAIVTRRR